MSEFNLSSATNAADLLAQASNSSGVPTVPMESNKGFQRGNRAPRRNLWKDTTIKPVPLDTIEMEQGVKAFSFIYNEKEGELPDNIVEKVQKVIKTLSTRDYTFRAWFNGSSATGDKIVSVETEKPLDIEWYLVTRNWNANVSKPTSNVDTELAYQIAKGMHKAYDKIPDFIRALCARDIELILGKSCKKPIKFLLVYSPCGTESITKDTDFKKLGQLVFDIRVCKDLNIPVFNLQKDDALPRLLEFLTGRKQETPVVEQTLPPASATPVVEEVIEVAPVIQDVVIPEVKVTEGDVLDMSSLGI